ncbi:MAG: 4-hydroxythreonine-4-phosphate dehydrogenase PdxA [Candidatus Caldatribacteriaceae bacterium]
MVRKPVIAITMGDPAGIGSEIVVKTVASRGIEAIPLIVGERGVLERVQKLCQVEIEWHPVCFPLQGEGPFLLDLCNVDSSSFSFGKVSPETGRASYEYIEKAIALALERKVQGVVTAPISKEALHLAEYSFHWSY